MKIAGLCSIPERENSLYKVLLSVRRQFDVVEVCLNDYPKIPIWMSKWKNVRVTRASNEMGDANKYINIHKYSKGIYFSIDDDLIYPNNYAAYMIKAINNFKSIVTLHGSNIMGKVNSYYMNRVSKSHCLKELKKSTPVHIGGTGVMAFDLEYFNPEYHVFKVANMADIWCAIEAKRQGKKITAIKHHTGWIRNARPRAGDTIYDRHYKHDTIQTDAVNSIKW